MKFLLSTILFVIPSLLWADAEAIVKGPTQADPGDLVILDASDSIADARTWILANSDKQWLAFEDGRKVVFACGTPGEYIFVLSVAQSVDDVSTQSMVKHIVTIGEPPPPVPPTPPPGPTPPPRPPTPDLTGVAKQVYDACLSIPREPGESKLFADALRNCKGESLPEIVSASNAAMKALFVVGVRERWEPFRLVFIDIMQENSETLPEAVNAIEQIAKGLDALPAPARSPSLVPRNTDGTIKDTIDSINQTLESIRQEIGQ